MIQWANESGPKNSPTQAGIILTKEHVSSCHSYHMLWRAVNSGRDRVLKKYWVTVLPACWGSVVLGHGVNPVEEYSAYTLLNSVLM